jgi:hypothetical protein
LASAAILSATTFAAAAACAATHAASQTGAGAGSGKKTGAGAKGVTSFDATDALTDGPPVLDALLVNVYGVPFVSPVTVQDPLAPVTVHVAPPGDDVTV